MVIGFPFDRFRGFCTAARTGTNPKGPVPTDGDSRADDDDGDTE